MSKLREVLQQVVRPSTAFVFAVLSAVLDMLSSMGKWPPGFIEQNPFARHPDGSFWPAHALIENTVDMSEFAILSYVLYRIGKLYSQALGRTLACIPWFYLGYLHFDAALHNLMVRAGLYVPLPMMEWFHNLFRFR